MNEPPIKLRKILSFGGLHSGINAQESDTTVDAMKNKSRLQKNQFCFSFSFINSFTFCNLGSILFCMATEEGGI